MDQLAVYNDVIEEVYNELTNLTNQAIKIGINKNNIIWDPGIGFAKTTQHNILLIKSMRKFLNSNYPLLIGPSRKKFIGEITLEKEPNQRIWGTAAVVCKCVQDNVDLVRVHDVGDIKKLILMAEEIWTR